MSGDRRVQPSPVRLPDDLRQYLKHAAVDNRRSLSGEILYRLEQSVRAEQGAAAPAAQQQ